MATSVSKTELKAHALELLRGIQATGQPLVVTDHGKPVLQIQSWRGETRTALDVLKGSILRHENSETVEFVYSSLDHYAVTPPR